MTGFIVISFVGLSMLVAVLSSQFASEQEESPPSNNDYYWGGLKLSWPIIMISLLVNHTTIQQLLIYNQQSFDVGYQSIFFIELITVVAMLVSALFIIPKLIEDNAKTIPEFIGSRYDKSTQHISAFLLISAYMFVLLPLSLLIGSWALQGIFEPRFSSEYIMIGLGLSGGWYALGGLRRLVISDGIYGSAFLILTLLIPILALFALGDGSLLAGLQLSLGIQSESVSGLATSQWMIDTGFIPWDALLTGMFVLQLFLWSGEQVTLQRLMSSNGLATSQKAMLIGTLSKIILSFLICLPAFFAMQMLGELSVIIDPEQLQQVVQNLSGYQNLISIKARDLAEQIIQSGATRISLETAEALKPLGVSFGDQVYAALIRRLFPDWSIGIIAAVLFGLVISTFKSIVHSTVTLILGELTDLNEASLDHLNTDQATQIRLTARYIRKSQAVVLGKILVVQLTGFAIFLALYLSQSPSLLPYLQKVNGLWSIPLGIIFLVGLFNQKAPASFAKLAILISCSLYGFLSFYSTVDSIKLHWLQIYMLSFALGVSCLLLGAYFKPRNKMTDFHHEARSMIGIDLEPWPYARLLALLTLSLLVIIGALLLLGCS